jgi:hypothetical protein|tara:strand:+ start:758 stop:1585 length:828 start_codon:yes stop_codon:yes gene_type:complete
MNILLFDLENGSKSIGSRDTIQKHFGLPVLSPGTFEDFTTVLNQLYKKEGEKVQVMVGDTEIGDFRNEYKLIKPDFPIDAIVIDTFSELSKKYQRKLTDLDGGTMKIGSWGKLKSTLDRLLERLVQLPGIVICNCHSKIQTMDTGGNKMLPYIDGSTKEDVSKWFDFVLYAGTVNKHNAPVEYVWHTQHSSLHDHAKDRTQLLDAIIPQDYQLVLNAANKRGYDGAKILIIGSPGTGKTYSLRTLKSPTKKQTKTKTVPVTTASNGVDTEILTTV